jgi:hypothetical protein
MRLAARHDPFDQIEAHRTKQATTSIVVGISRHASPRVTSVVAIADIPHL